MNFIADTPEDVSGWVEGKKNIIRIEAFNFMFRIVKQI